MVQHEDNAGILVYPQEISHTEVQCTEQPNKSWELSDVQIQIELYIHQIDRPMPLASNNKNYFFLEKQKKN